MDDCRTMRSCAIALLLTAMTACTGADGDQGDAGAAESADRPTSEPASIASQVSCEDSIGADAPESNEEIVGDVVALPSLNHPALQAVQLDDADTQALENDLVEPGWTWAKRGLTVRGSARIEVSVPDDLTDDMRIGWGGMPPEPLTSVVVECAPEDGWLAFAGGFWVSEPGCYPVNVTIDTAPTRQVDVGIGEPCPGQDPPAS